MKCRNANCNAETLRHTSKEVYDKTMNGSAQGFSCPYCGFSKMLTMVSGRSVDDRFVPGWQESIRAHCDSYSHYKRLLKERGLVEIGTDYIPHQVYPIVSPAANMEFINELQRQGETLTGNEIEGMLSGQYFKDARAKLDDNP